MRIGVYGGTFDPIHRAHLDIAQAALEQARLDRVLFVVAGHPPHKAHGTQASPEDRYAMTVAALEGHASMEPCRIELDRPGPSYTIDTLKTLSERYPGAEFFLIIGMDMAADFPKWRSTAEILERARLLVIPRPGPHAIPETLRPHCTVLEFSPVETSSTDVRERVQTGASLDDILPPAVVRIIAERRLYRG